MDILVKTIPHAQQRYETCGDWQFADDGALLVSVSELKNTDHEFLVVLHEAIEAMLCKKAGVSEQLVTAFDKLFEAERDAGLHGPDDEPGDDRRAPYFAQHQAATRIERRVAKMLGVSWEKYEAAIAALGQEPPK